MTAPNYPDIGTIGGAPAKAPAAAPGESLEDLRRDRDVAKAKAEQAERLLQQTIAPKPPAPVQNLGPAIPGEMPDSSTDPDAFKEWMAATRTRDRWEAQNYTDRVRDAAVSAGRSDRIIDEYLDANPKYRNLRDHVFEAFKRVCVDLKLSALPDDASALNAAVDKKMAKLVAEAAAAVDDLPTGDPQTSEETPPGRTAGLSAGSKGASAGGTTPKEDDGVQIKSLYDVIRDRQAASGLF